MTISIECSCGKKLKAPPTLQGKTVPCPNCKAPITVPVAANQGEHHPAAEPPPSPPATAAEILMQCQCGQQFKVAAQYAGHQVNCPGCQVLCQIPHNTAVSVPTVSPALPKFLNHNLLHHRAILNRIKLTITTLDFPNKVRPKIRSKGIHRKPIHSRPIHSRDIRSKGIHQRLIQKQPVMKRKATVSRKD